MVLLNQELFRQILEARSSSPSSVAKAAGVSERTVQAIIADPEPRSERTKKVVRGLERALGCGDKELECVASEASTAATIEQPVRPEVLTQARLRDDNCAQLHVQQPVPRFEKPRLAMKCAGGNVNFVQPVIGGRAISCSSKGAIQRWDLAAGTEILPRCTHVGPVNCVTLAHGLILAACAGPGYPLGIWDEETGTALGTGVGHDRPINHVTALWGPHPGAVTASADKTLRVWDLRDARQPRSRALNGHTKEANCVRTFGHLALSCGADGALFLWDTRTASPIDSFKGHVGAVNWMVWPRRSLAFSGGNDGNVCVWSTKRGVERIEVLPSGVGIVTRVGVSEDLQRVVACGSDGTMAIWSPRWMNTEGPLLAEWSPPRLVAAHSEEITDLQVYVDRAVTTSYDGAVRLWSLADGSCLADWRGHGPAWGRSAAFLPEGTGVVSGGNDENLYLWQIPASDRTLP